MRAGAVQKSGHKTHLPNEREDKGGVRVVSPRRGWLDSNPKTIQGGWEGKE